MTPKNILVTEDEAHMRRLLQFIFEKTGHRVALTGSGEEAVARAEAVPPDLLVIDLTLPGIDGFETVRRIRAVTGRPELPVILLTARGQEEIREAANEIALAAFFTKPFSPSELFKRALELLG